MAKIINTEAPLDATRRKLLMGIAGTATVGALGSGLSNAGTMHGPSQPTLAMQQVCYVVDDLDVALKYWTEELNAGPFFLYAHVVQDNQTFRGKPVDVDVSIAIGNSGAVQIELVLQHNKAPSPWKEWQDAGRRGIHHFGYITDDYQASVQHFKDKGNGPIFECTIADSPLCYLDTLDTLGHYVEIFENSAVYRNFFRATEQAARNWDGKNPVRPGT